MATDPQEGVIVPPWLRWGNIALRTAHIAAIAALFGGHVFGAASERLIPSLYGAVGTGALLALVEALPDRGWFVQSRGVLSLLKTCILCLVPLFWNFRIPILAGVMVLGSVGSHMPFKFRHYRVLGRAR
jgi:hypothetical protein